MLEMKSQWKYFQIARQTEQMKNWSDCIKQIAMVSTYPEVLYTLDMTGLAGLENLNDLNFFKNGVQPMWEDVANKNGGRIIMELPLLQLELLQELWRRTIIFCAIEAFPTVTGCVYAEKVNYRICLWIGDSNLADEVTSAWKHVLDCEFATFSYISHDRSNDFARKGKRSITRNK